jgi:hypothetical protein
VGEAFGFGVKVGRTRRVAVAVAVGSCSAMNGTEPHAPSIRSMTAAGTRTMKIFFKQTSVQDYNCEKAQDKFPDSFPVDGGTWRMIGYAQ